MKQKRELVSPPGPEACGLRYLLEYKANYLCKNFILSTRSRLVDSCGAVLGVASLPPPRKVSGMHPKRLNTVNDGVQAIHIGRH
jgi:hypothetical protein